MNEADRRLPILKVEDLTVSFSRYDWEWNKYELEVIHCLDVDVYAGEILAVAGASGSGKSILAHSVLNILPDNAKVSGTMKFKGDPITERLLEDVRGRKIAFIPQSVNFLDPLMKVGKQIQGASGSKDEMKKAMKICGLDEKVAEMYPFQLSGGMARRVLIATAFMENAELVIADEPTPGLDADMAADTLRNFRKLADMGCGVMLITHDIDLALEVADRVAVFYAGTTVEICSAEDFRKGRDALRHPYSKAFIDALPQNGFKSVAGSQPYAGALPKGCLFYDRCSCRTSECGKDISMRELRGGKVRCIHAT